METMKKNYKFRDSVSKTEVLAADKWSAWHEVRKENRKNGIPVPTIDKIERI